MDTSPAHSGYIQQVVKRRRKPDKKEDYKTHMATITKLSPSVEFLQRLAAAELFDVKLLRRETAEKVLTEKRMELLAEISTGEAESIRDLARKVDRDVSVVSRDLDILFEADVIDYEKNGRMKKPVLSYRNIIATPIVYQGDVIDYAD